MDKKELSDFIERLGNVADEPRPGRARTVKVAASPVADGWGGRLPARDRAVAPTSDESIAYLNALTAIRIVFKDGRETVTTVQKVDEAIEEEKESRRRAARRRGA